MRLITVEILGVKLEADLLNPKVARKYDDEMKKVVETANKAGKCGDGIEGVEMECNAVIGFIDNIFGPGSARKVLGEETDLLTCLDVWEDLTGLYENQVNPLVKERTRQLTSKYEQKNGNA
jgi:hypothetical protein